MTNVADGERTGGAETRTGSHVDASRREHAAPHELDQTNSVQNPETTHTRSDAPRRERVRQPPPENWIVIDQAIKRFAAAGLPIKLRTLQKYCLREKIRATLALTDKNTFKYFLDPASVEQFIAGEAQKAPTEGTEVAPAPAQTAYVSDASRRARARDDLDVFEHPYVKRLEREVDDYKHKYHELQSSARADLIKLHETYAVAQSETLAKYLLLNNAKSPPLPPQQSADAG